MKVYVAIRNHYSAKMEVLGVYSTRAKAVARCTQWEDGVGALTIDEDLPEETAGWPEFFYPVAEAQLVPAV